MKCGRTHKYAYKSLKQWLRLLVTKSGQYVFTQLQWKYFATVLPRIQCYKTCTQKKGPDTSNYCNTTYQKDVISAGKMLLRDFLKHCFSTDYFTQCNFSKCLWNTCSQHPPPSYWWDITTAVEMIRQLLLGSGLRSINIWWVSLMHM